MRFWNGRSTRPITTRFNAWKRKPTWPTCSSGSHESSQSAGTPRTRSPSIFDWRSDHHESLAPPPPESPPPPSKPESEEELDEESDDEELDHELEDDESET